MAKRRRGKTNTGGLLGILPFELLPWPLLLPAVVIGLVVTYVEIALRKPEARG